MLMLDPSQKSEIISQCEEKKKELQVLRSQLHQIHTDKELWFNTRKQLNQQKIDYIHKAQAARQQRDSITSEVKQHKEKRDQVHTVLKTKVDELKHIVSDVSVTPKTKLRSPEFLRKQIATLEYTIETAGITFDKEQKLMKQIKELKRELQESKYAREQFKKKKEISNETQQLHQEAQLYHKVTQERAKQSQSLHKEAVGFSKEIDELKKKESEANTKFLELKAHYAIELLKVKQLQKDIDALHKQLDEDKQEYRALSEQNKKKTLQEKKQEVEEKLKKGKGVKLTMEDLLAFQGTKE